MRPDQTAAVDSRRQRSWPHAAFPGRLHDPCRCGAVMLMVMVGAGRSMIRAIALLLTLGLVAPIAGAGETPPLPPAAIPFAVLAPAGLSLSVTPTGQAGSLRGGGQVTYERCLIHADTITFWLSPVSPLVPKAAGAAEKHGGGGLALERAVLDPGPAGPAPDRVLIDTRATRLPTVGFRGLLRPQAVRVQRWPVDPQAPGQVFFNLDLDQLGEFVASVRIGAEWVPLAGWASYVRAELVADLVDGVPANYRFHALHLHGEVVDGRLKRPALVVRTRQPLTEPRPITADDPLAEAYVSSEIYSLAFTDQGEIQDVWLGNHSVWKGEVIPQRPPKRKSRPVPVPAR